MVGEKLHVIRLRNDFYRDGFQKAVSLLILALIAIGLLVGVSIYLFMAKPRPVSFSTDNEWRVVPAVALDQEYIRTPNLLQWVEDALPHIFNYDFLHYMKELEQNTSYFTPNGWQKFLDIMNLYIPYNDMQKFKSFATAAPTRAPIILNKGLIENKFGWWVQIPINLKISAINTENVIPITLQILIVRVPTLNNIYGIGIDNIMVVTKSKSAGGQVN